MHKFPSLNHIGQDGTEGLFATGTVFVQEKLDGSNWRFSYNPHTDKLEFGSRNTKGESLQRDQFEEIIDYIERVIDMDMVRDHHRVYGDLTYFGEGMNPHTLSYDWDEIPWFIGFDVWSEVQQQFMHPEKAYRLFDELGLPTAELVDEVDVSGSFDPSEHSFDVPVTEYSPEDEDVLAEGLVFKNHNTGTYAKHVRDEFKEKNKRKFGGSTKPQSDTETLAYEYATEARIRDTALDIVDETDWSLEMSMMEDLPKSVIKDTVEEEGVTIFMEESYTVDLGEFRSIISSRSASILQQMIDERARETLGME